MSLLAVSISQNKKWKYYLEPQLRFVDDAYKFEEANLFAGVYYQWTPALSFWLGVYRQDVFYGKY